MNKLSMGRIGIDEASTQKATVKGVFTALKPLGKYVKRYLPRLLTVAALVILSNVLALSIPVFTGRAIDAIQPGSGATDFPAIFRNGLWILLVALITWVLESVRNLMMLHSAQAVIFDIRSDVFIHLSRLPLSFFDKTEKGDIMSRVSVDIDNISETISNDVITLLTGFSTVVGALIMMLAISPPLTLVFVVTIPMMLLTSRSISKRTRILFRDRKRSFGMLSGNTEEMVTAQKTVKVFGLEDYSIDTFLQESERLAQKSQSAEFLSSTMMPCMNFINNLNFLLISIFGCLLYFRGGISIGDISSFIIYSKKFAGPIVETANLFNTIQSSIAACDRVFAILKQPVEPDTLKPAARLPQEIQGAVAFENVSFSYIKGTPVIQNVSFTAPPGESVAIVGATGSGKTTLISLLLRFYEPDSGRITIDGIDIQSLPLAYLRRQFALVLQDNWLFDGTISENIGYAADCTDPDRIRQAVRDVEMEDYLAMQPQGCDTLLSSDSSGLSQGQKQLLTIARAMLCNPPMLIFDEATSSVDTQTEAKVKTVVDRVMENRTTFIIAHRLSTILNADKILVVKNGRIVECGSHQVLMRKKGAYYDIYQSQFAAEQEEPSAG